jgi:hypothetical protein
MKAENNMSISKLKKDQIQRPSTSTELFYFG